MTSSRVFADDASSVNFHVRSNVTHMTVSRGTQVAPPSAMTRTWLAAAVFLSMAGCLTAASVDSLAPSVASDDAGDAGGADADDESLLEYVPTLHRSGPPADHRPMEYRCESTADAGEPAYSQSSYVAARVHCMHNADCTARPDGHCADSWTGRVEGPGRDCVYDDCSSDADCPGGGVCQCAGWAFMDLGGFAANTCVPATCHTDRDCGHDGGVCSPSKRLSCDGMVEQYACHFPTDVCSNDADCLSFGSCRFSGGAWTCSAPLNCD